MNNELSNLKYIKVSDGLENPTLDEDIFKYPVVGRLAMGMDAYRSPIDSKDGSDIINSVNPTLRVPKYGYVPRLGNKGQTGIKTALTTKIVVGIVGLGLAGAALLGLTGDDGDNDAFQDNVNGANITIPIIENMADGVYNKSLTEPSTTLEPATTTTTLPEYIGAYKEAVDLVKTNFTEAGHTCLKITDSDIEYLICSRDIICEAKTIGKEEEICDKYPVHVVDACKKGLVACSGDLNTIIKSCGNETGCYHMAAHLVSDSEKALILCGLETEEFKDKCYCMMGSKVWLEDKEKANKFFELISRKDLRNISCFGKIPNL